MKKILFLVTAAFLSGCTSNPQKGELDMSRVKHSLPHSSPQWLDKEAYPFDSKFIKLSSGDMHYIDEGEGPILLFVHGTPTWSFVYRNQIKELAKSFRCIAIDHLGFGLSEKPENFSYTPEQHAANLQEFVDKLDLESINLVVHDFGGPIGLSYAVNNAPNINSITIMNTWMWSLEKDKEIMQASSLLGGFWGRLFYKQFNFSVKFLMPKGFYNKQHLTPSLHQQYIKAFPDAQSRHSTWVFARELKNSSQWFASLESKIDKLADKKIQILWGMKDELIKPHHLTHWKTLTQRLNNVRIVEIENAGHFVQEEAAQQVAEEIRHIAL